MIDKAELKKFLLENCVDEDGDLYLSDLDFSDFEGDIYINGWQVARDLFQSRHIVCGDLLQRGHNVEGSLYQTAQNVGQNLYQGNQRVGGKIFQGLNKDNLNEEF